LIRRLTGSATYMAQKLDNYLKTHRKRAGFSQDDIAFLIGMSDGTKVSRYERRRRRPSLETALALEALFGVPTRELFPGVFLTAEQKMRQRARQLSIKAGCLPRKQVALKLIAESESPNRSSVHAQ